MGLHGLTALPTWLALAGVVVATTCTWSTRPAGAHQAMFGPVYTLLDNKYYMDWLWIKVIAGGLRCWVSACGRAATPA
jgi:NADH-quinone oxidoreductase subunit L